MTPAPTKWAGLTIKPRTTPYVCCICHEREIGTLNLARLCNNPECWAEAKTLGWWLS